MTNLFISSILESNSINYYRIYLWKWREKYRTSILGKCPCQSRRRRTPTPPSRRRSRWCAFRLRPMAQRLPSPPAATLLICSTSRPTKLRITASSISWSYLNVQLLEMSPASNSQTISIRYKKEDRHRYMKPESRLNKATGRRWTPSASLSPSSAKRSTTCRKRTSGRLGISFQRRMLQIHPWQPSTGCPPHTQKWLRRPQ